MDQESSNPTPAEKRPPRGAISAKMDDKGRLKLPAAVLDYLGERKHFFITSNDKETARIYPIAVWESNEKALEEAAAESEEAERLWDLASYYGKEESLDDTGRLTIKPVLRRDLEFEGKELCLICKPNGIVDVVSDEKYRSRNEGALVSRTVAMSKLKPKGFV